MNLPPIDQRQLHLAPQLPGFGSNYISEIEFIYPGLPISVNSMYANGPKGRYLTKEGRNFKKAFQTVAAIALRGKSLDPANWYDLLFTFYRPLMNKNNTVKKWDVSNHVKAAEDALSSVAGIDDKYFLDVRSRKLGIEFKHEPVTHVRIRPINVDALIGEHA